MSEPAAYVQELGIAARKAALQLAGVSGERKIAALHRIAGGLRGAVSVLLEANKQDLSAAEAGGVAKPLIERLKLDGKKIEAMAVGVEQIAAQVDPVGQTIEACNRPNGLRIEKRRVPIGVVLFFYESRPNVTSDAAALCIKSGNAVILRGGKEAFHTNREIGRIIQTSLSESGLPAASVQIVESTDRALVPLLLKQDKHIDLVIPRGGESLIRAVVRDSTIPVLKHFTGNCHLYVDRGAEAMAEEVVQVCVNAKTSYPGGAVCNAVEHLLFHRDVMSLVPPVLSALQERGVEVRGDERVREVFPVAKATSPGDWDEEYLAFIVGVKIVDSIEEAIEHINAHGSHHTDGILSTSLDSINQFVTGVDSASIMINASTRFADGGEYGLGAEIGISTDKLHARGPMGAMDLTTYKWIITGNGHCR